jgi:hypothetical protein
LSLGKLQARGEREKDQSETPPPKRKAVGEAALILPVESRREAVGMM